MRNAKIKDFNRLVITVIAFMLFVGSFNLIVPGIASAAPSESIEITGDGVSKPVIFSREQLQAMQQEQQIYSTINTWPSKKWYVGQGVSLRELLSLAGIKDDARLIKFSSNDGYTLALTVKELFEDERYYFPHLMDNSKTDGDGNIAGSPTGAEAVEAIIALQSVEGSDNPRYMNDLNTMLLMIGQRAVTEQTGNLFVKYLNKIEVLTTEAEKWDSPQANPDSGQVPPGTMVALSNAHMDDDKIYYTRDGSTPTINSPMYNWIAKRWWSSRADVLGIYNKPIGPINENTIIKAITIGPGKEDSDVVTFSYEVSTADTRDNTETAKTGTDEITADNDSIMEKPGDEPEEESGTMLTLSDIESHWAQNNIEELVSAGAIGGYPDATFKPDYTISRAEFATILVKAFDLELQKGKVFNDTANHWARDYIAAANAHKIVDGYSDSSFGPDDSISREQMAVMISRAAKLEMLADESHFADSSDISAWAVEALATCSRNGIMKGYPGNTIKPQGSATRAEAVTVIVNSLNMHESLPNPPEHKE